MSKDTIFILPQEPTLPVEESLVDEYVQARSACAETSGPFFTAKRKLRETAVRPFFELNRSLVDNGHAPVFSAILPGNKGAARIAMTNSYSLANPDDVRDKGFNDLVEQGYLVERCDIRIDSDKIPEASRIPFVLKLKELAKECGVGEDAISYSHGYAASSAFHKDRYRLLSIERNLAIQKVMPTPLYIT